MDYEIVPVESVPVRRWHRNGKWQALFLTLDLAKAVKFTCATLKDANHRQASILGSRRTANNRRHINLHTRIMPNGDHWLLFVWREPESKS